MLGVKIGNKHTFNDYGLKWEDVTIALPEPKTNYIDRYYEEKQI